MGQPESLLQLLARPDLQILAKDVSVQLAPQMPQGFTVLGPDRIVLGAHACAGGPAALILLRHALEVAALLRLCPDRPALAGLAAARTAALFAALEGSPLAAAEPPSDAEAAASWSRLAAHQPGSPVSLPDGTAAALRAVWPLLGPTEWLMQSGGDVRLRVDPATGLNGYGCSHRPRPWAVTFASSTASSSSERGYAGAEAARRRIFGAALHGSDGVEAELEAIRHDLAAYYRLPPGGAVILAASGTDCELFALALAQMHPAGQPVTNVLVAPEETGTGVPLAATGRHFAIDTARSEAVVKEGLVAGFRDDTILASVTLRDPAGCLRPSGAVDAECASLVDDAVRQGRRTVLHLLDVSKTGLLAPGLDAIRAIEARHPGQLDVVVDACQARVGAGRARGYVEQGWMVLVTGSKFFTGPPFAGAVLVPPTIRGRLDQADLPGGLGAYSGRAEWPQDARGASVLAPGGNLGLVLRWQAALAEMRAFAAAPVAEREAILRRFVERVRAGIVASPCLRLVEVPPLHRPPSGEDWDILGTILSFAVCYPATGAPMAVAEARQLYRWLNADLATFLPPELTLDELGLARRRFHIGQPVPLRSPAGEFGALRISAGARLVTGEPSHAHLGPAQRLEREIGDALAGLAKIELILRHLDRLRAADPPATFL